ncbi:MAG TPA: hypothetical protein VLU96_05515 [Gaiellaceae bacterium]|nr:hypothetical protein [Gaiellaceae bacterium]
MKRAVLLAGLLVVAGCGGTTGTQQSATPTRTTGHAGTTTTPTTTTSTSTTGCPSFGGGTSTQTSPTTPANTMLLTAVQASSNGCTDRISFTFRPATGRPAGYTVGYRTAEEAQTQDASGKFIPIAGKAFLVIRFEPAATADLTGAKPVFTYTGPWKFVPARTRYVRQLAKTGDFEAVLTWAIGLSEQRPFTVSSSGSPARVTIEIG